MSRFDQLALEWDKEQKRVENARKIGEAIVSSVPLSEDMNVMDFGAGTGLLTLYIQPYVKHIDAVDNSEGMLSVLKEKIEKAGIENITPVKKDLEKEDFGEEKYDLIVSSMTMHHIKNLENFLKKLYRVLKKGGYIAVADLEKEDGTFHSDNEGVYHFGFDKNEIVSLFQKAGFKDISIKTVNKIHKNDKDYGVFLIVAKK